MILEYHILQNLPPANINRDDNGEPKTAMFGGFRRSRISSQSFKRAIRQYFDGRIGERAVRTSKIYEQVQDALTNNHGIAKDEAVELARTALNCLFKNKNGSGDGDTDADVQGEDKSKVLVFADSTAFKRIADICAQERTALETLAKSKPKAKNDPMADERARVKKLVSDALTFTGAVDIALFGRMLAEANDGTVEAAASVAHAISTNEIKSEYDFFTAVDDLQRDDEQGAGMMGQVSYNSSCFYRYIAVDLDLLKKHLAEGEVTTAAAITVLTKAIFHALPSGMQKSFAAYTRPLFGFVTIREENLPLNLADAFLKPIRVHHSDHLGKKSIETLAEHWGELTESYEDLKPAAGYALRCGSGETRKADLGAMDQYAFEGSVEKLADALAAAVQSPASQVVESVA